MKVLVTGATGMLGRAVAQTLITRGEDVTVLQRGAAGLDCREVRASLADQWAQGTATRGQDAVIHLAAKVDVAGRGADFRRVNVTGTEDLLRHARQNGVARFVHVSSPAVAHSGGALVGAGAGPADPVRARGNYARSKAAAEQLALAADGGSLAVAVIRPHLVWGPGDTQLIARIVERGRTGRLVVIGTGAALIDTTYVTNAADALVAALDRCEVVRGRPLVVSNGEPRPIAEILVQVCRSAGLDVVPRRIPYPVAWGAGAAVDAVWAGRALRGTPADPPITRFLAEQVATAHWFDQRQTRRMLNWRPLVDLSTGFQRLARWYAETGSRQD